MQYQDRIFHLVSLLVFTVAALLAGLAVSQAELKSPLRYAYEVAPGDLLTSVITLANGTDVAQSMRLYLVDYSFDADGNNRFSEPGTLERSNAGWIELTESVVTVEPGTERDVEFVVGVPNDTSYHGSYWSLIVAEPVASDEFELDIPADEPVEVAAGFRTVIRYGIQVVTTFQGTGEPQLLFSNPVFSEDGEHSRLSVDIANTGTDFVVPDIYLELYSPTGAAAGRFETTPKSLLPEMSVRQNFELGELATGSYIAIVVADGGGDDIFGVQYQLDVE